MSPPQEPVNTISVKEFREAGYLQELNRRFLHPLGLALEVLVSEHDGTESLGRIWDYRDDPEGIIYEELDLTGKAEHVESLWQTRKPVRVAALGYMVQPA